MSRKCPPELKSGVDRVLDVHTPTCDTCILTWGGLMSSVRPDPPSLRATLDAFNALMRAVPWVYQREGSRPEASSKDRTPATQEQRERLCSKQHRAGCSWPLDPSEARSALLVCCRFIRYQSNLLLVSRGSSLAFGMSRECPPELVSGIDRVLHNNTPTRDTFILTQAAGCQAKARPHIPQSDARRPQRAHARCTAGVSP